MATDGSVPTMGFLKAIKYVVLLGFSPEGSPPPPPGDDGWLFATVRMLLGIGR